MAWKNSQSSLGQLFIQPNKAIEAFDDIDNLIYWGDVEAQLSHIYNNKTGNSAYPPLMMFKALLLQVWHKLSDEQLERSLARDLAFRRFVGLDIADAVPDHSTIWRFREKLQDGTWEKLLNHINNQLIERSIIVQEGSVSVIDASVVEAKNCRKRVNKHGQNTQDPEGGYAVKKGSKGKVECTYGFKNHTNVDEDGFIKKMIVTAGNVHDSQRFEALLTGKESAAYGDSAYKSQKHDAILEDQNSKNGIISKGYRNKPLTKEQKAENKIISSIRYVVERTFGILELRCNMGKARYNGLARTTVSLGLMSIMHNLKRGLAIANELSELQETYA